MGTATPLARLAAALTALPLAAAVACSGGGQPSPTPVPTVSPTATQVPGPTEFIPPGLPPAWPFVFSGSISAGGAPVPAGYTLVGRVDDYESEGVETLQGRYFALTVGPLKERWFNRPVTFYLVGPDGAEVQAEQTETFVQRARPSIFNPFDLTFPSLP